MKRICLFKYTLITAIYRFLLSDPIDHEYLLELGIYPIELSPVPKSAWREGIFYIRGEQVNNCFIYFNKQWYVTSDEMPRQDYADPGIVMLDKLNNTPDKYLSKYGRAVKEYWKLEKELRELRNSVKKTKQRVKRKRGAT